MSTFHISIQFRQCSYFQVNSISQDNVNTVSYTAFHRTLSTLSVTQHFTGHCQHCQLHSISQDTVNTVSYTAFHRTLSTLSVTQHFTGHCQHCQLHSISQDTVNTVSYTALRRTMSILSVEQHLTVRQHLTREGLHHQETRRWMISTLSGSMPHHNVYAVI